MEIWPAIDLRGGKCVRLQQGDYARETVFGDDPAAMARQFAAAGAECLHLVDLDGARDGALVNLDAVRAIVAATPLRIELGGGIRDEETARRLLDLGLERVVIGTRAARDPEGFRQLCQKFPGRVALGIDARDGQAATDGWLQTSDRSAVALAREFAELPLAALIYTDIATDGMLQGPNVAAMADMAAAVSIPVIASGGVTTVDDVRRLAATGVAGCIIGRALYEGRIRLEDALQAARQTASSGATTSGATVSQAKNSRAESTA